MAFDRPQLCIPHGIDLRKCIRCYEALRDKTNESRVAADQTIMGVSKMLEALEKFLLTQGYRIADLQGNGVLLHPVYNPNGGLDSKFGLVIEPVGKV